MSTTLLSHCPHCRTTVKVNDSVVGKRVRCPACQKVFEVASVEVTRTATASLDLLPPVRETIAIAGAETKPAGALIAAKNNGNPEGVLGSLGRFKLCELLGQGAFGRVYKAHDPQLDRFVALKVPTFGPDETYKIQRFNAEAKAAARLRHPNIVPTYESGQIDGQYYIAAQFVAGQPLAKAIKEKPPEIRQAAEWVRQLAGALAYAHSEAIVHRDIKPENIMLDAKGMPQIMDFGLAKRLNEDSAMTTDGSILGTPAYMSPEQARGDAAHVGPATDQYSLGVVLYELLTGHKPFDGPPHSVIAQVLSQDPPAPRTVRRDLPLDLAAICEVAISKRPDERYATCSDLADDLARWLGGYETRARNLTLVERAARWCRRNPAVAGLTTIAAALLILGTAVSCFFAVAARQQAARATREAENADRHRLQATREAENADRHRLLAARESARAWLGQAAAVQGARSAGYRESFLQCVARGRELGDDLDWKSLQTAAIATFGDPLGLPPVEENDQALARLPAAARGARVSSSQPLTSATGKYQARFAGSRLTLQADGKAAGNVTSALGTIHCACLAADESVVAVGCEEGAVVWRLPDLTPVTLFRGNPKYQVAVHPEGYLLATLDDRHVEVWSIVSNRRIADYRIPAQVRGGFSLEFDAAGSMLLCVSSAGQMQAGWNILSTPERQTLLAHRGGVPAVRFSPDGALLASCSKDRTARLWDVASGKLLHHFAGHPGQVQDVAFSADGKLLASGDWNGCVCLWDVATGADITPAGWKRSGRQIWDLEFDPLDRFLCAAVHGGFTQWPYAREGNAVRSSPARQLGTGTGYDLAVNGQGERAAVLLLGGTIQMVNFNATGTPTLDSSVDRKARSVVYGLAFHPDGDRLRFVGSSALQEVDLRDAQSDPSPLVAFAHSGFSITADGKWCAALASNQVIAITPLENESDSYQLPSEDVEIWCIDWSADGSRLALGLTDGRVVIWNLDRLRAGMQTGGWRLPSTRIGSP